MNLAAYYTAIGLNYIGSHRTKAEVRFAFQFVTVFSTSTEFKFWKLEFDIRMTLSGKVQYINASKAKYNTAEKANAKPI